MSTKPRKVLIFGLDGPVAPRLLHYCREGRLPTLARLIANGVLAPNAMVPLPTATPANWTSIATGAWPATHGIGDYTVRIPGDPLDRAHMAFHSPDVKAEYLWNAIARAGKRSAVVNFVTTWPPVVTNGVQIGGSGCDINQWFHPNLVAARHAAESPGTPLRLDEDGLGTGAAGPGVYTACAGPGLFCTEAFQPAAAEPMRIRLGAPAGWSNLPAARTVLAAELVLRPRGGWEPVEPRNWQLLVLDTQGNGFERVLVCTAKDGATAFAELSAGQWSPVLRQEFVTASGVQPCAFALKLLALSPDAGDLRLYHSALCALDGWSHPPELAQSIVSAHGLPTPDGGFHGYNRRWFGADTLLEELEMQRRWYADACTHVLAREPWELFVMRYHLPDTAWHSISHVLDPRTAATDCERREHEAMELGIYQACDRLAHDLLAGVDESETLIALISDHGSKPAGHAGIDANTILADAGLLARSADGIDWSRTRAIARPVCWVHINLAGRDPDGIVQPGEEYAAVQQAIVRALTGYVDPASGHKPVLFALRREDARFLNIHGEQAGDVIYALRHDHGYQHGPFLPTADWQHGSLRGLFALCGPGVRRGVEIERNVWCIDLVPTICHLTGWPVPRDTEGAVVYQALEQGAH
ncbi:MAG: hypothetical protein CALGDGBN_00789 [Pseudomonadales bacterium]|nr:hypothetical protein [Pseudomonadales bacterium]